LFIVDRFATVLGARGAAFRNRRFTLSLSLPPSQTWRRAARWKSGDIPPRRRNQLLGPAQRL